TARELRSLLATSGHFFDRGVPVKLVRPPDGGTPIAMALTVNKVVIEAHNVCRPMKRKKDELTAVTLPDRLARIYLSMPGEWNLPPLVGICTAPILSADGTVRIADGYDAETGLWCSNVPHLAVPTRPSRADAEAAFGFLRQTFQSFPFADAPRRTDNSLDMEVVDIAKPPGRDESTFHVAQLTAVCRQSLGLAPGALFAAPEISGAGSGKGMLVRAISAVAFGNRPRAFTAGGDRSELDKRLAADLIEAQPVLFLDNANGRNLRSETLASVLTERPARVRTLGKTEMVLLNSAAFIAITGNGLTISEDLARRFILVELDARCEDPELRPFPAGFLNQIMQRRAELLTAVLVIWRWGRQNTAQLQPGRPLGSFEQWAEWCRDPLIALGCCDPVERIGAIKADDPHRRRIVELFNAWSEHHRDRPVKAADLAEPISALLDPQGRGRQHIAARLAKLENTRAGGFVLTRQRPAGHWGVATYALVQTNGQPEPSS
ncbi:MAG: hypothetical protein WB760_32615, partial [Xanthobacteraceae bacterium]